MNKNILYIRSDEHEQFYLGIYKSGHVYINKYICPIGTMSEKILSNLQSFMKKNKISFSFIDAIVVYLGPGSYTSLRIGISCANALAFSKNIPIYGITKSSDFNLKTISKIKLEKGFNKPVNAYYQQAV